MIIGINGKIGSGKDTLGKIIQYLDLQQGYPNIWGKQNFDFFINVDHSWVSKWEIKKFGGKLKEIASLALGIPIEHFEDQEFKKTFLPREWDTIIPVPGKKQDGIFGSGEKMIHQMTVREFLQLLGTEACRDGIHQDFWVNTLFVDYKPEKDSREFEYYISSNWIITDLRFPNELKAIKDRGGKTIKIIRKSNNDDKAGLHPSETSLDNITDWDYIIENDGTIEELIEAVKILNING